MLRTVKKAVVRRLPTGRQGFTIVEVLIVLAIGGVIMATVFLAVPQLQRNSRDQARKSIATRLRGEIENYASNNEGNYPFNNVGQNCNASDTATVGDWADFFKNNIKGAKSTQDINSWSINLRDPSTMKPMTVCLAASSSTGPADTAYVAAYPASGGITLPSPGILDVVSGARCNGANVQSSSAANSFAVIIGLETANTYFCIDNS